jgi:hypothetical protein
MVYIHYKQMRTSEHLSYEQRLILNPKSPPTEGVKIGKVDTTVDVGELKSSQEYVNELKEARNRFPNLGQSRIATIEKNFVKSYMKENNVAMQEAQKVFRQLTQ